MPTETDVLIIGAGIVGLALGLRLSQRYPGRSICIVEKESAVALHQTSHNSGVVHSGIYYRPGSLKARLCVQGAAQLLEFCRRHGLPFDVCGKLIIATREEEFGRLQELHRRGEGNGLQGLRLLDTAQIREIEPHAAGLRGIHVPSTAIVDYRQIAEKYAELIAERGGLILVSHEATAFRRSGSSTVVETTGGAFSSRLVINCAGLHSDRVSRMSRRATGMAIVPFRGEYYEIAPQRQYLVRALIYPVPDPQFPFLGVHFTRRVGGGIEAGPNAVLAWKREGYSKLSFHLADALGLLTFGGFWKMGARHWRMAVGEYQRSWSKKAFLRGLQRLVPELRMEDLRAGGSGVRAQAVGADGALIDDFHIEQRDGMIHVGNVPSPAATASLAIADYIIEQHVAPIAL